MMPIRTQRGSTLLVALIMLVLLTLIAISAMSSTTASIQVVGNAQFREEANSAAQRAIENVLSGPGFMFATPAAQNIDINQDGTTDFTVNFEAPSCLSAAPARSQDPGIPPECVGLSGSTLCYWTMWDIEAAVSDVTTGASVIVHQGVRTIAGLASAATFCGV